MDVPFVVCSSMQISRNSVPSPRRMEAPQIRSHSFGSSGKTLLDMIRDEDQSDHAVASGNGNNRINWRGFKDRLRKRRSSSPADAPPQINQSENPPPQQITMSLMALLEQTDINQGARSGVPASSLLAGEDDREHADVEDSDGGETYVNCCVCVVRRKGAAFIPCGHTFCRLCSRELWVSRGSCPLCNGFILEILDIY